METGSIPLESRVARVSTAEKKSLKLRLSYAGYIYRSCHSANIKHWTEHNEAEGLPGDATRRYCICEGIEEIKSNEFEVFSKFVSWVIARKDRRDRNGFVFLWGEGLKFCSSKKLRSNNDHISHVRGSFFGASFGKLKFLEKSRSYHCTNEKRLHIFAEYEKNFRSNN